MIVVDTNIIAYRFIQGEKTPQAMEAQRRDPRWVVPALCRHEFLNVLATATRQGILTPGQSSDLWSIADPLLQSIEQPVDFAKALALSIKDGISAYDAQYIALAQHQGILCLTEDRVLQRTYPNTAISLKSFLHIEAPPDRDKRKKA